jgi:hypothetical protein
MQVPEAGLGLVADSCPKLTKVSVFGCPQVTRRLLHGHSNDALVFEGVGTSA